MTIKEKRIKEIKKELSLFNYEMYKNMFEPKIMYRGERYFLSGKVKNIKSNNNEYTAIVSGTNDYNVLLRFDGNKIDFMSCECEHYKSGNNCKHIYSLIVAIKYPYDYKKICNYCEDLVSRYKLKYDKCNNTYMKKMNIYSDSFKDNVFFSWKNNCDSTVKRLDNLLEKCDSINSKVSLATYIEDCLNYLDDNIEKLNKNIEYEKKEKKVSYSSNVSKTAGFASLFFGLFKGIINGLLSPSPNQLREDEMDKWAKEEAKNGNYEPYVAQFGFIEDNMELYDDEDFNDSEYKG